MKTKYSSKHLNTAFEVYKEQRLIVEVISGLGKLDSYLRYKSFQSAQPEFNGTFDLITVSRNLVFDGLISEVDEYIDYMKKNKDIYGSNRRVASVIETPNHTAYIRIFEKLKEIFPQEYRVFYSLEDGYTFLGCEESLEHITQVVDRLYKNPTHNW